MQLMCVCTYTQTPNCCSCVHFKGNQQYGKVIMIVIEMGFESIATPVFPLVQDFSVSAI